MIYFALCLVARASDWTVARVPSRGCTAACWGQPLIVARAGVQHPKPAFVRLNARACVQALLKLDDTTRACLCPSDTAVLAATIHANKCLHRSGSRRAAETTHKNKTTTTTTTAQKHNINHNHNNDDDDNNKLKHRGEPRESNVSTRATRVQLKKASGLQLDTNTRCARSTNKCISMCPMMCDSCHGTGVAAVGSRAIKQ